MVFFNAGGFSGCAAARRKMSGLSLARTLTTWAGKARHPNFLSTVWDPEIK